jgi:predicted AAA+ superfamily ATPase
MTSSPFTETSTPDDLSNRLAEIQAIDAKIDGLMAQVKLLEKRRDHFERLCVEDFAAGRIDRLATGGRMWRVEWTHSLSATEAGKGELLAAAEALGIPTDAITQVNTAKLKAIVKEIADRDGKDVKEKWTSGTPLEGLVGEYVAPRLRSVKAG